MPSVTIDNTLTFDFPEGWDYAKFDEWVFYRNQLIKSANGIQAVDLIAIDPKKTAWFIEVKDFRSHSRTNPASLSDCIRQKVHDSLAALFPAKLNASDTSEKDFAAKVLDCKKLRVVFHGEQPKNPSKLFPASFDRANLQKQLRARLKPVDPHVLVVSKSKMPTSIPWTVR